MIFGAVSLPSTVRSDLNVEPLLNMLGMLKLRVDFPVSAANTWFRESWESAARSLVVDSEIDRVVKRDEIVLILDLIRPVADSEIRGL